MLWNKCTNVFEPFKKTEAFPYKPQVFSSKARFTGEHETRSKFFGWDLNRHQQAFWERNYRRPIDSPKTNGWNRLEPKNGRPDKGHHRSTPKVYILQCWMILNSCKEARSKGRIHVFMSPGHMHSLSDSIAWPHAVFSLRPIKFSLRSSSFKALQSCLTDHEIFKQTTWEYTST